MELLNSKYWIISQVEYAPLLFNFDIVHNTENVKTDGYFSARVFQVMRSDGFALKIALLDLICSTYEPYSVLSGNELTVILFDSIVRIDLDTGLIVRRVECNSMGGLFEIHQIDGGYLIWGEGEIFRYDLDLNQIWRFSGRDILVSLTKDRHFWIEDGLIHCRDFEGWHYVLNFEGKLLSDFQEKAD